MTSLSLLCSVAIAPANILTVPPCIQLGNQAANGRYSLALVWHTPNNPYKFELKYGQGTSTKTAKLDFKTISPETVEPHRVYAAALTGLKPGDKIQYELRESGSVVYTGTAIAPKSDRQDHTFAVFGDCGTASLVQAQISYQASRTNPDLLVLTGDIVYDNGRVSEYKSEFWPYHTRSDAWPSKGSPLLTQTLTVGVPGNHDILMRDLNRFPDAQAFFYYWNQPLNGPLTQVGEPGSTVLTGTPERLAAFQKAAGPNYPRGANFSFDYGNAHWTCLDANPYVDWTNPKLHQWLKDDLAKAAKKTWRFVSYHQPSFHSSTTHQGEKQMRLVQEIFEEGKVDIVFCGHVHNSQRTFPIQVGAKKGASREELVKDDWAVDKQFDGVKNLKPNGVIHIVDGAGGRGLYNVDFNGAPEKWKPFQAIYIADHNFSHVTVKGKRLVLKQISRTGTEVDRMTIQK